MSSRALRITAVTTATLALTAAGFRSSFNLERDNAVLPPKAEPIPVSVSPLPERPAEEIAHYSEALRGSALLVKLFDESRNSALGGYEFDHMLRDDRLTGQVAALAAGLFLGRDSLEKLDARASSHKLITVDALVSAEKKLPDALRLVALSDAAGTVAQNNTAQLLLDSSRDKAVSKQELERAIGSGTLSPEFQKAFEELHAFIVGLEQSPGASTLLADGKLSFREMEGVAAWINEQPEVQVIKSFRLAEERQQKLASLGDVPRFGAHGTNPIEAITPAAVQQAAVGDCFFLSTLASLAAQRPGEVLELFYIQTEGSSGITFPGVTQFGEGKLLNIGPTPSEAMRIVCATPHAEYGSWVAEAEYAFGFYRGHFTDKSPAASPTALPAEHADGGDPREAIELLTGREAGRIAFDTPNRTLVKKLVSGGIETPSESRACEILKARWAERQPMVLSIAGDLRVGAAALGLHTQHAYAVIDVTGSTPSDMVVTVMNPWNLGVGRKGVMQLSFDTMYKSFNVLSFGTDVPLRRRAKS